MIKNKFFVNFIMVILLVSFLTFTVGKVTPVYALALPSDSFVPIYDTQIVDIANYLPEIEASGGNPVVFFILCGLSVISYAGFAQYKLEIPYDNPTSTLEWVSNVGVRLYNTVASLSHTASVTLIDPLLDYIHGAYEEYNRLTKLNVNDINTFIDYYNTHPEYSFKVDKNLLPSVNQIMALNQKLYDWQFQDRTFDSGFVWKTTTLTTQQQTLWQTYFNGYTYQSLINLQTEPNDYVFYNCVLNYDVASFFSTHRNIFINTQNHKVYMLADNGNADSFSSRILFYNSHDGVKSLNGTFFGSNGMSYPSSLTVREVLDLILSYQQPFFCYETSSRGVIFPFHSMGNIDWKFYYGTTWSNKAVLDTTSDLNFDENPSTYVSTPYMDTFINIKDIITDISNGTDNLYDVVFDNIYDISTGVNLVANDLYNISVTLQDLVDNLAPPVPVNLNDIAELTDNTYLERVKEHARNAGDIFADYVAFWHNCDSDLVYTMFGAAILVLVGAFIGKWGHS